MTQQVSQEDVHALRHFNRFYTRRAGILEPYLNSQFSLTEVRILYEIAHNDTIVASQLVEALGIDSSYLSRILKNFEKRGWISKKLSQTDHRQTILSLTPAGREAYEPLQNKSHNSAEAMLGMLNVLDRRIVLDAMRTIENRLSSPFVSDTAGSKPSVKSTTGSVRLRNIEAGDLGWVVQQHGEIYEKEYGWNVEFETLVAGIVADLPRQLDSIKGQGWIAEYERNRVGAIFLIYSRPNVAKIRLLIIHPSARGMGLGYLLTDTAIDFARQAGYEHIELWTHSCLKAARKIYTKRGFRLIASEAYERFGHPLIGETWTISLASLPDLNEISDVRTSQN